MAEPKSRKHTRISDDHGQKDPPYEGAFIGPEPRQRREIGQRLIRCLHTDHDRPPKADDPYEFHWRCSAIFQCEADDPPYCAAHRRLYAR